MLRLIALFATLAFALCAANAPTLSGEWSGTIDVHDRNGGDDISTAVTVHINQTNAEEISGKIGREGEEEVPIQHAHLDGNHITFEAGNGETDGAMHFDLTVNGADMKGLMKGSVESMQIEAAVKLHRAN